MSEKERWIVYPLIFFALGAAIRDKLIQSVESRDIVCESLTIKDLDNPDEPLAILSFDRVRSNDPSQPPTNVGSLHLIDSDRNVICSIEKNALLDNLTTQALYVVDPHEQKHILVKVATEQAPQAEESDESPPKQVPYQGVIFLNNERVQAGIKIAPPQPTEPPKPAEIPQQDQQLNTVAPPE